MKLLNSDLRKAFPPLGFGDGKRTCEIPVVAKFFDPSGSWVWYATEFDGEDTFFGLVDGWEAELGYFGLSELESIKGKLGIGIERDLYYENHTLEDANKEAGRGR